MNWSHPVHKGIVFFLTKELDYELELANIIGKAGTWLQALGGFYADGRSDLLAAYTDTALHRVWRATHFSWFMTSMLHVDPHEDAFGDQLALAQLDYVTSSRAMATALAENYTGIPFENGWSYR